MGGFLINEVSTLFVNANVFLAASATWRQHPIYKWNGIVLLVTFALFRVAFNVYNLHHMVFFTWAQVAPDYWPVVSAQTQFLVVLLSSLAFAHGFINVVWFVFIVLAVKRKMTRSSKPSSLSAGTDSSVSASAANGSRRRAQGGTKEL